MCVGQLHQAGWLRFWHGCRIGARPGTARLARLPHRRAAVVGRVAAGEILGLGPWTPAGSSGHS